MKHLLGLVAFALAVAVGVGLTISSRVRSSSSPPPPATPSAATVTPTSPPAADRISPVVRQVTLNRRTKQATVAVDAWWRPGAAPPSTVWVVVVCFVPERGPVFASEPARITIRTGAPSVEATVSVPWVGSASDPGSGYFARVDVTSTLPVGEPVDAADLAGAVPVILVDDVRAR